jgi:hypothetical protein
MSSRFAQAMSSNTSGPNGTTTWNGALSHSTSGSPTVDLFYAACRGLSGERLEQLLTASYQHDPLLTLKIVAYVRDVRGGKGERALGRQMLKWLGTHSETTKCQLIGNIEQFVNYGRYDDVFELMDTPLKGFVVSYTAKVLKKDKRLLNKGQAPSLAAKWFPSEGKALDRKYGIVKKVATALDINKATLRKDYIAPLRKKIGLLESHMCDKNWSEINFEHVPSNAMNRYSKPGKAFERNCKDSFAAYKVGLSKGEVKVNASVLFPHQIVQGYIKKVNYYYKYSQQDVDPLLEAQWTEQLKKLDGHDLGKCLVLSDVSGSMECGGACGVTPMDVSISLGIMVSQLTKGPFHNLVLTFESQPQFFQLDKDTLLKRVCQLKSAPWGGSTNFIGALDLILQRAKQAKLTNEDMPNRLIVVSDMQFNQADYNYTTNYQALLNRYKSAGYDVPKIVYWNVNGSVKDFPTTATTPNVSLVSGFSIDILKCVLEDMAITPETTMFAAVDVPRYSAIKVYQSGDLDSSDDSDDSDDSDESTSEISDSDESVEETSERSSRNTSTQTYQHDHDVCCIH